MNKSAASALDGLHRQSPRGSSGAIEVLGVVAFLYVASVAVVRLGIALIYTLVPKTCF